MALSSPPVVRQICVCLCELMNMTVWVAFHACTACWGGCKCVSGPVFLSIEACSKTCTRLCFNLLAHICVCSHMLQICKRFLYFLCVCCTLHSSVEARCLEGRMHVLFLDYCLCFLMQGVNMLKLLTVFLKESLRRFSWSVTKSFIMPQKMYQNVQKGQKTGIKEEFSTHPQMHLLVQTESEEWKRSQREKLKPC